MAHRARRPWRPLADPFMVPGPSGVAVRTRLKHLTAQDEKVLRVVGGHLASLEAGVRTVAERLAQPLGAKGTKSAPGGYRSRREWFGKARRLACLEDRLAQVREDWDAGAVHVVRGGRKLANSRHHLEEAGLTEAGWRREWQARRWFLQADGESGKRYGNETIRLAPDGQVSVKLPAPLAHLANAPHGRYVLDSKAVFAHRGGEWADRVCADRAVAYRIHHDAERDRWYVSASWTRPQARTLPLAAARAKGVVGVDMNADHLAAYRLDAHGNPAGDPERFSFDLSGSASRRDAQVRHALTRLLHWTRRTGAKAIGIEDLDFTDEKTREKHGRKKRFRQLISGMPTAKLRARIVSMAAEFGIAIVAVDPAYTSEWGAQHWARPLNSSKRTMTRHGAAAVAIGRRALGHPVRRRTAPPRHHRSDGGGPRTVQVDPDASGREGPRRPATERAHDARRRAGHTRTRGTSASNTVRDARSDGRWVQDPLLHTG